MTVLDYNVLWYLVVGALFAGYAVLDGFDLGVGALHLFARTDEHRRLMLNSIGPVWDGNEVWLVVGGGALFAAFPNVYATVFSGFYLAMMLLLCALIFRAVAIEFRSKQPMRWWRQTWDVSFSVASIAASLLLGVALGNLVYGIPLDASGEYSGGLLGLLRPYPLLTGVTTVALFMMHGAIYLVLRTEGELHDIVRARVNDAIIFFVICYATTTMATLLYVPQMRVHIEQRPLLFVVPLATMLAIANIPREMHDGRFGRAFLSSCFAVVGLWGLVGIGMFPALVNATDPSRSLTLVNSASSEGTLRTMTIIASIGIPLVAAYTVSIYWIFRGKVRLGSMSY
jgi:cytochrome bd ubiquinol oxidase subunit II